MLESLGKGYNCKMAILVAVSLIYVFSTLDSYSNSDKEITEAVVVTLETSQPF